MTDLTPSRAWGVTAELAHDSTNLYELIAAYASRQDVPCVSGRMCPRDYWISDVQAERKQAAAQCLTCPVLDQCRAYGLRNPNEWGVYGSLDQPQRKDTTTMPTNHRATKAHTVKAVA